ncbi:MAG TPA: hypothetical protein DCY42_09095 [Chloroflexi bacterium]|nr:hypothetical protein [Chloroflexota bacterium]
MANGFILKRFLFNNPKHCKLPEDFLRGQGVKKSMILSKGFVCYLPTPMDEKIAQHFEQATLIISAKTMPDMVLRYAILFDRSGRAAL